MTLLVFLIVLSVLVFVHELGHFLVAKKSGIKVEEFGFGLPPRLVGKKVGETIYSLNWLPIGGFVRLFGEDREDKVPLGHPDRGRAFFTQSLSVRLGVIIAGVVMNFLLGVVLFSVVYSLMGIPTETKVVRVVEVTAGSPADQAGIKSEEVVLAVNGELISSSDQFVTMVKEEAGKMIEITLGEEGKHKFGRLVRLVPRPEPPEGEGALGIVISSVRMVHFPAWQMPIRGAWFGLKEAAAWGAMITRELVVMLRKLIFQGVVPEEVAGPVGIFQLTSGVAKAGILALLQFVGVLSVNLAVLNLVPFPALDGGRLVFLVWEAIVGRRVKPQIERWIHVAGMAFLIGLMILVTLNDLVRLTGSTNLSHLLRRTWPF